MIRLLAAVLLAVGCASCVSTPDLSDSYAYYDHCIDSSAFACVAYSELARDPSRTVVERGETRRVVADSLETLASYVVLSEALSLLEFGQVSNAVERAFYAAELDPWNTDAFAVAMSGLRLSGDSVRLEALASALLRIEPHPYALGLIGMIRDGAAAKTVPLGGAGPHAADFVSRIATILAREAEAGGGAVARDRVRPRN